MEKELHLFIIWEKGRYLSEPILADIASKFKILQTFNICWPKNSFAAFLARFYGKNLPKGCRKERECGDGDFLAVVVEDNHPIYEQGQNLNMTDAKGLYRRWFQGRNYIHCSDCAEEGVANLEMLLGLTKNEFYNQYGHNKWDGRLVYFRTAPAEVKLYQSWLLRLNNLSKQLLQNLNLW